MCSQDNVVKHLVEQGAKVNCKDENDVRIVHGPRTVPFVFLEFLGQVMSMQARRQGALRGFARTPLFGLQKILYTA